MPDITMCPGGSCPDKERCYRFIAEPNPFRQSYFMSPPRKDGECNYFSPTSEDQHEAEVREEFETSTSGV